MIKDEAQSIGQSSKQGQRHQPPGLRDGGELEMGLEARPEKRFLENRASETKGLWFDKSPKTLFLDGPLGAGVVRPCAASRRDAIFRRRACAAIQHRAAGGNTRGLVPKVSVVTRPRPNPARPDHSPFQTSQEPSGLVNRSFVDGKHILQKEVKLSVPIPTGRKALRGPADFRACRGGS